MCIAGELLSNYGPIYEVWFDGGVPPELAEDIGVLVDSHAPDAVSFQGPSRHSAGLSGNVVSCRLLLITLDGHLHIALACARRERCAGRARRLVTLLLLTCGARSSQARRMFKQWRVCSVWLLPLCLSLGVLTTILDSFKDLSLFHTLMC